MVKLICPKCQSTDIVRQLPAASASVSLEYLRCESCGSRWCVDASTQAVVETPTDVPQPKKP